MALTPLQVEILQLLARRRKLAGESYVAGGVALNQAVGAPRLSRDIDLFHDTDQALMESWMADRQVLRDAGYSVETIHEARAFVEASIAKNNDAVLVQWVRDSAFRFFPLIEDDILGLTLHPLDLAANKVLAMVGRLEPRDWIDLLSCHTAIQPLGYLVWAACGKDPGFSPEFILDAASRHHYPQAEINLLSFEGSPPSAAILGHTWKTAIAEARSLIQHLPEDTIGQCLLDLGGHPYSGSLVQLNDDLPRHFIYFHGGSIGGVWPTVKSRTL